MNGTIQKLVKVLFLKYSEITRGDGDEIHFGSVRRCRLNEVEAKFFVASPLDVIQRSHVVGRFYEEEELAIISSNFGGGVFVDIGANVGNHAVYIGFGDSCSKVIAFEPNAASYSILSMNIHLNNLGAKIIAHEFGLADDESEYAISGQFGNLGATTMRVIDSLPSKFKVIGTARVAIGDDVLAGEDVSFIKIDVEGFEIKCLLGLMQTIRRCQPRMFVEVSDENLNRFRGIINDLDYVEQDVFTRHQGVRNILVVPRPLAAN